MPLTVFECAAADCEETMTHPAMTLWSEGTPLRYCPRCAPNPLATIVSERRAGAKGRDSVLGRAAKPAPAKTSRSETLANA